MISAESGAEIEAFVYEILADRFDVPAAKLSPTTDLLGLGVDSLGAVEVGLELKREYGVGFVAGDIPIEFTVAAIVHLVRTKLAESQAGKS